VNNTKPIGLKRDKPSGGGAKIFVSNTQSRNQMGLEEKMKTKFIYLALAAVLASGFAAPAFAQSTNWKLNSDHSTGRLSLSSTADPTATFDAGIARVKGSATLDPNYPANSSFNFTIYPADQDPSTINQDGSLNAGEFSNVARSTVINFRSKQVKSIGDGNLEVTGDMTLSHLERPVIITYNEAYSGAVYGEPEVYTVTREVTFVLDRAAAAAARAGSSRKLKLVASVDIKTEDFPGLFEAVTDANWPVVVADKECEDPSAAGEDYQGAHCTGNPVVISSRPPASFTVGEDYPATEPVNTHVRDNVKIALNLELTRNASTFATVSTASAN
jgi:polyisoprenoid-binding protein YceI